MKRKAYDGIDKKYSTGLSPKSSNMESEGEMDPQDFAKKVLTNTGYVRPKKDNIPILRKGSNYLKMMERNPSL